MLTGRRGESTCAPRAPKARALALPMPRSGRRRHWCQRGHRRASARAFGARGAHVGLVARGPTGLAAAARDVEAAGGKACVLPTDVADPDQCEAAAEEVERTFGPIDVWVNVAFTSVFSPFAEIAPGRVQAGHRGDLPRLRVRDDGRAAAHASPRRRHHRPGRLRAGIPGHPAADRLLRRQARRSRASTRRCAASCCTRTATSA